MFVVVGANGKTGGAVARAPLAEGQPVRVVLRTDRDADRWRADGAGVAVADVHDPASLIAALTRDRFADIKQATLNRFEFHTGDGTDILHPMPAGCADVAFFDGFEPTRAAITALVGALRPGRLLIAGNMTLGGDATQIRDFLANWQHTDLGETVLAVKPGNNDPALR